MRHFVIPVCIALLALCGAFLLPDGEDGALSRLSAPDDRTPYSDYVKGYLSYDSLSIALVGVKVIDGTGGATKTDQTVLIEEDRITALGPSDSVQIPAGTEILNLAGRTVIPGIVGTHNHTHMPGIPILSYTAPRLYLASGVTTIQTTGSAAPYAEQNLAGHIQRGFVPGPDIIHTGPYITGKGGSPVMIYPEGEEHIENLIRYWVGEGVTWFKAYRHIAPEHLRHVIATAHKYGAKVTGHLCTVTYAEAARMGIDAIEHGFIHSYDHAQGKDPGTCSGSRDFRNQLDIQSDEVRRVHQTLIEHNVALTSTLSIFEAQVPSRAIADTRTLEAMAPPLIEAYQERQKRMEASGTDWYFKEAWLQKSMAYDYAFFKAGGLLTAGLDPGLHNLPGYGDQRNFELLVEAGFSAPEAIQVMTSNGARLLDKTDIGTIEVGKRADLVVLHGDPEADPRSIKSVEIVFKEGYGFDPSKLIAAINGQVGYR